MGPRRADGPADRHRSVPAAPPLISKAPSLARRGAAAAALALCGGLLFGDVRGMARTERPTQRFPNVLVVTIDTLRADRVSAYGYRRPTTPHIDKLLATGARFSQARTVEPLTQP
ncbi:MAG TPA: hypothetical protein DD490_12105, partial [Acidobacteria bacterium]|nr:hypothetical protein [Acidobacteriota bacterium]